MPVPTSYTENEFAEFLHSQAGVMAALFGWSIAGRSYDEIVNDTLLAAGVTDIASANVGTLRILGRMCLWQVAKTAVIPEVNYSADGQSYSREAIFQHVDNMLSQARVDAIPFLDDSYTSYQVDMIGVARHDPYVPR